MGFQPVIEPGQSHEYVSGCNFKAPIGKMSGTYLLEKQLDGEKLIVKIPEFVNSTIMFLRVISKILALKRLKIKEMH